MVFVYSTLFFLGTRSRPLATSSRLPVLSGGFFRSFLRPFEHDLVIVDSVCIFWHDKSFHAPEPTSCSDLEATIFPGNPHSFWHQVVFPSHDLSARRLVLKTRFVVSPVGVVCSHSGQGFCLPLIRRQCLLSNMPNSQVSVSSAWLSWFIPSRTHRVLQAVMPAPPPAAGCSGGLSYVCHRRRPPEGRAVKSVLQRLWDDFLFVYAVSSVCT